jgi:hypothetical protein
MGTSFPGGCRTIDTDLIAVDQTTYSGWLLSISFMFKYLDGFKKIRVHMKVTLSFMFLHGLNGSCSMRLVRRFFYLK